MARTQAALHVGQGDIGDGVVERLHQGRDHGATHDEQAMPRRQAIGGQGCGRGH
jgi:hypothetical protein